MTTQFSDEEVEGQNGYVACPRSLSCYVAEPGCLQNSGTEPVSDVPLPQEGGVRLLKERQIVGGRALQRGLGVHTSQCFQPSSLTSVQASLQMPSCPPLPNPLSTPLLPALVFGRHKPDLPAPQLESSWLSISKENKICLRWHSGPFPFHKLPPSLLSRVPRLWPHGSLDTFSIPPSCLCSGSSLRHSLYPHTSVPPLKPAQSHFC